MDVAVYSHVEYSDCWPAFFGEFNKYCTVDFDNKYIFSNELNGSEDSSFQHIAYNDNDAYTDRLLSCLKQLGRDKVLFTHEDMILCDTVDENYLKEAEAAVDDVDFVKLLKGGSPKDTIEDIRYKSSKVLKYCRHTFDYVFSIQPTIWKTERLIELLENNLGQSIWEFETVGQEYCRKANYKGLYSFHRDDVQRGHFHWHSTIYPYIATAIHKGKWVTSEYPAELAQVFSDYDINPEIRGEI